MFAYQLLKQSFINKTHERFTPEQIHELQQRKFRKLIHYINEHSPYYKKIIKKQHINPSTCIPKDFPILTKNEVIAHFDAIVTDSRITKAKIQEFLARSSNPQDLFLNQYSVIHTSGSSGVIGYYVYSEKELAAGISHFTRIAKPRLGQKLAYVAATKGHFAGITMITAAQKLPGIYQEVKTFDINEPFAEIISELNRMQPTTLIGYAFALKKLAEAQTKGILKISPHVIESSGEPLSSEDKESIQNVFHVPVINVYASSEHLLMGIGQDDYEGMYLMEDDLIFEITPDFTCVTNLFNYTLPLIRYKMSDTLQPLEDTVRKLPFTKIANIVGRNEYVPVFINERGEDDFISPILLVEMYIKHVTKFQIHLQSKQKFLFNACLEPGLSKLQKTQTIHKINETLRAILDEKLMTNVTFQVEIVKDLWTDPQTGKFRLIVKTE